MADKNSVSQPGAISGEGESDTPQYVTRDELNQMLNGFRKSSKKDLETALQAALAPLAALTGKQEGEAEATPAPAKGKMDPEKEELKKQVKMLLDRQQKADAEAAELKLQTSLRDNFTKHGIDPRHVDHAIAFAKHNQLVRYDDDGSVVMKVNQIDMPLQDAVAHWVKTDEAKLYLAPRGVQGSGQRGPVRAPSTATQNPSAVTKDNVGDMLLEALSKQ